MGYCGFTYTMTPICVSKTAKAEPCYFDIGCSTSLINWQFLKAQDPIVEICLIASPLKINGIVGNQHTSAKYVITTLQIQGKDKDGPAEAVITRKLHIVDHLDANMLIGTDVMLPKKMDILLLDRTLRIGTYNVDVLVQLQVHASYQQHLFLVHAKATTSIPLRSTSIVPIHSLSTVSSQDFLFEPIELDHLSLFSHVMNANVKGILVKNSTSRPVSIPQNMRLGHL